MKNPFLLLGYPDSNQERQDQNLQCYHYTIAQSNYATLLCYVPTPGLFLFASAKLGRFFYIAKYFGEKIQKDVSIFPR